MMTKTFLTVFFMFIVKINFAAIITVDNNYPKVGDYATLQEAHDAANNGDTIYVFPSLANYSAITLHKSLHIIGSGFQYFQQGVRTTLAEGTFDFTESSNGSSLSSFGGNFNIIINADNIKILRNKLKSVKVNSGHTGTIIKQNFLHDNNSYYLIDIEGYNEVFIANNIIKNHSVVWYNIAANNGKGIIANQTSNTSAIIHNVIDLAGTTWSNGYEVAMDVGTSNTIAYNNIILIGPIIGIQTEFYNNLLSPDLESVFVNFRENDYHLKSNSPAIGAGYAGVDMGIYSGETQFVDGGYPSIPSIYYLDVPLIGTQKDGINVTIKAKSNQ
jgi:hypothetical protein